MKNFFTLLLVLIGFSGFAQTEMNPVELTTSVKKISDTEYDLIFHAKILDQWHLYSQYNPDGASQPIVVYLFQKEKQDLL